jgi:AbrB family looped-hinge helix DNA binding protein
MIIKRFIGEKGQVVIPSDIRKMLNLQKGNEVIFEIGDKEVKIKKEDTKDALERFFTLSRTRSKDITLKELKKIENESYDLP